jgi:RecA-family ATPase
MNENTKTFDLINAAALLEQEFEPLQFAVEKILPHGLFILAGSGKIGKSWLALDMCTAVSSGGSLWDFHAEQGAVLYLALEDNQARLQGRLNKIEAEKTDIKRLHLVTAAFGINSGLIEQTHNHLAAYPDTKLIIIDTLERIRDTEQDKSMYSCDYRDMNTLRSITDAHKLTLLLIHHTRKMYDPDPLNTLSGSTGLVGSVDGVFVLEKEKRTSNAAKLTIANRDTEGFCFRLEFDPDNCKWLFIGNDSDFEDEEKDENDEPLLSWVDKILQDEWSGTATALCDALKRIDPAADVFPRTITKRLKGSTGYFKKNGINIAVIDRDREKRGIKLTRQGEQD